MRIGDMTSRGGRADPLGRRRRLRALPDGPADRPRSTPIGPLDPGRRRAAIRRNGSIPSALSGPPPAIGPDLPVAGAVPADARRGIGLCQGRHLKVERAERLAITDLPVRKIRLEASEATGGKRQIVG